MVSSDPNENGIPDSYKVIYQIAFKTMYFDENTGTVITIWNSNSANITDEDYMNDTEATMDLIRESEAKFMISDHRENRFIISPDLQKWYAELIAHVLGNSSFEKCAVVITTDLNLLSALEEIRTNIESSDNDNTIAFKFFNGMKDAEKWINSKGK